MYVRMMWSSAPLFVIDTALNEPVIPGNASKYALRGSDAMNLGNKRCDLCVRLNNTVGTRGTDFLTPFSRRFGELSARLSPPSPRNKSLGIQETRRVFHASSGLYRTGRLSFSNDTYYRTTHLYIYFRQTEGHLQPRRHSLRSSPHA